MKNLIAVSTVALIMACSESPTAPDSEKIASASDSTIYTRTDRDSIHETMILKVPFVYVKREQEIRAGTAFFLRKQMICNFTAFFTVGAWQDTSMEHGLINVVNASHNYTVLENDSILRLLDEDTVETVWRKQ